MSNGFFVTGTDTGVGKTCISLGLMQALQTAGYSVAGMKPVASGCERVGAELVNDDALRLQKQSTIEVTYSQVNPYAFAEPIAPHLAAQQADRTIELDVIREQFTALSSQVDWVIVEGIGGWLVPITGQQTMADVTRSLELDVILVVRIRLGCLNHALLTAAAIKHAGLRLAGWVANGIEADVVNARENIATLADRLSAPLLAELQPQGQRPAISAVAEKINLGCLEKLVGS